MADVILSIPDLPRFVAGMAAYYGYRETIDGEPNPEGAGAYVERKLKSELKSRIRRVERQAQIDALTPPADLEIE